MLRSLKFALYAVAGGTLLVGVTGTGFAWGLSPEVFLWIGVAVVLIALAVALGHVAALHETARVRFGLSVRLIIVAATLIIAQFFLESASPYARSVARLVLGFHVAYAAILAYAWVTGIFVEEERQAQRIVKANQLAAAEQAARNARLLTYQKEQAAEAARLRAARLAELERFILRAYAEFAMHIDFAGELPDEQMRAAFLERMTAFNIPDIALLNESRNPGVRDLLRGVMFGTAPALEARR